MSEPNEKRDALLETTTRTIPAYFLYADEHDMLGVEPNGGPVWGHLEITNEVNNAVRPYPMRKCELKIHDEPMRQHWGDWRVFWIRDEGDLLVRALAHVNGQQE